MSSWAVYILRCKDDSLYTGITVDVAKRLVVHNAGKGAKYTRSRLPVVLVWSEVVESEGAARVREGEIKKLSRAEKEKIIA